MKAKQWVKDYLDFAMPLIMAIVGLNLFVELGLTDSKNELSIYVNGFYLYSLICLGIALFLRLFTDKLLLIISYPMNVAFVIYFIYYGFINGKIANLTFLYIIIVGLMIFVVFNLSFRFLKIFFANCHFVIKNISYVAISILGILILFAEKLAIIKLSLSIKQDILMAILCLVVISILYIFAKKIYAFSNKFENIIIPQDISEWKMALRLEAETQKEAIKEKRERNRIINDIADAVRRKL